MNMTIRKNRLQRHGFIPSAIYSAQGTLNIFGKTEIQRSSIMSALRWHRNGAGHPYGCRKMGGMCSWNRRWLMYAVRRQTAGQGCRNTAGRFTIWDMCRSVRDLAFCLFWMREAQRICRECPRCLRSFFGDAGWLWCNQSILGYGTM